MRVRLLVDITGTYDGKDWPPRGSEVELDEAHAVDMVRAGYAVPADEEPPEDTRAADGPEVERRAPVSGRRPRRA